MRFWRKSFTLFAGEGTSPCKKPGKPFTEVERNSKRQYVQYWLKGRNSCYLLNIASITPLLLNLSAVLMVNDRLFEVTPEARGNILSALDGTKSSFRSFERF
jgi:hypothetical protein